MLNRPAASAAPVEPPATSACARSSATARAAWTIEASGVERTALTGSGALAIETGASTTSTPSATSPIARRGRTAPAHALRRQRWRRRRRPRPDRGPRRWRRPRQCTDDGASGRDRDRGRGARARRPHGPPYVPHAGHTRCGRRGLWHCGQAVERRRAQLVLRAALVACASATASAWGRPCGRRRVADRWLGAGGRVPRRRSISAAAVRLIDYRRC